MQAINVNDTEQEREEKEAECCVDDIEQERRKGREGGRMLSGVERTTKDSSENLWTHSMSVSSGSSDHRPRYRSRREPAV